MSAPPPYTEHAGVDPSKYPPAEPQGPYPAQPGYGAAYPQQPTVAQPGMYVSSDK